MKPTVEGVLAQLRAGVTAVDLAASFMPPERRALLRRCAAARTFDQAAWETILAREPNAEPPAVSLGVLVEDGDIEAVPNNPDHYRLPPAARIPLLQEWLKLESIEPILKTTRALGEALEEQRPKDRLELLYLLALSAPDRAARLFEEMYGAADEAFDLARCTNLVATLDARENEGLLHDARLQGLRIEYRTYLGARTLHASDFYLALQYLEREDLTKAFDELVGKPTRWILQLFAPGGMGKTMFERWLVAHRCIPKKYSIPCARVDFDLINPRAVVHSWTLLYPIVVDLDEQIPGQRFAAVRDVLARFEFWLLDRETKTGIKTSSAAPDEQTAESFRNFVPALFIEALRDLPGTEPVIVIFDTLEEVILRKENPAGLIELMGRIYKESGQRLRLIVAGRYELGERQCLPPQFAAAVKTAEIEAFSEREMTRYLQEKRKLPPSAVTQAVVKRAKGNPLKLAIYADLLRDEPQLKAKDIEDSENADNAFLIYRIVKRILQPQVRWLLRYGVIPRRLTRRFLEEVMALPLAEAMSGRNDDDNPLNDPVEAKLRETLFPTNELQSGTAPDLTELWRELGEHAARYAWISVAPGEPDTLIFHSDVFVPMRALLSKYQPRIYRRLHELGAKHYEGRATVESERWGELMSMVLYHRAEAAPTEFAVFGAQVLDEAKRRGDDETWIKLTEEIAVLEKGTARRRELTWLAALAAVRRARRTGLAPDWKMASDGVDVAREISAKDQSDWPEGGLAAAAIVAMRAYRKEEAEKLLRAALAQAVTPTQRLPLLLALGEQLSEASDLDEARTDLEEVWDGREALYPREAAQALDRLITIYRRQMAFDRLVAPCRAALEDETLAAYYRGQFTRGLLDGLFWLGQFDEVVAMARRLAEGEDPETATDFATYENLGLLWLEEPVLARDRAIRIVAEFRALDERAKETTSDQARASAMAWRLIGLAQMELLDFKSARYDFEQARGLFVRVSDRLQASRLSANLTALVLDEIGDLRSAETYLKNMERSGVGDHDLKVLRARFEWRAGQTERAISLLNDVCVDPSAPATVRGWARVGRMALGGKYDLEFGSLLAKLAPATRGLLLSDALRQWPGTRINAPEIVTLLRELPVVKEMIASPPVSSGSSRGVPMPEPPAQASTASAAASSDSAASGPEGTRAALALRFAEALYFAGDKPGSRALVLHATAIWLRLNNHFGLRKCVALAYHVLEVSGQPTYPLPTGSPWDELHGFMASVLLGRARWSQRAGDHEAALQYAKAAIARSERMEIASRLRAKAFERAAIALETLGREAEAADCRNAAAEVYLNLNDAVALASLPARLTGRPDSGAPFIRVTSDPLNRRIDVESRLAQDGKRRRREGVGNRALLDEIYATAPGSIVPNGLVERFVGDWLKTARELSELLLERQDLILMRAAAASEPGWQLPLEISDPALSALPWEFLVSSQGWLNWIFASALRDFFAILCNSYPLYRSRPRQGQPTVIPPRTGRRVLICAPSQDRVQTRYRSSNTARFELELLYNDAGFSCELMENPTFDKAMQVLGSDPPDVLHLSATMKESPNLSAPFLDFGRSAQIEATSEAASDSGTFTASALHGLLSNLPPEKMPVIILDIAQPPGLRDTVRQLLLRNSFASELYGYAAVPAVIASGLVPSNKATQVSRLLVESLAAGASVGEVVRAIRKQAAPARATENKDAGWWPFLQTLSIGVTALFNREKAQATRKNELAELLGTVGVALFTEDPTTGLGTNPAK